jgi:protein Tob/BTG
MPVVAAPTPISTSITVYNGALDVALPFEVNSCELPELDAAVAFWVSSIMRSDKTNSIPPSKLRVFYDVLVSGLKKKFEGHWYKDEPNRGQGFRCLMVAERVDGLLIEAATKAELSLEFKKIFPDEVVMYIDPGNVCVRYFYGGARTRRGSETTVTLYSCEPQPSPSSTTIAPSSKSSSSPPSSRAASSTLSGLQSPPSSFRARSPPSSRTRSFSPPSSLRASSPTFSPSPKVSVQYNTHGHYLSQANSFLPMTYAYIPEMARQT